MAYALDGINQGITADSAIVNIQPFTFVGWGRPTSNTVNTGFVYIADNTATSKNVGLGYSGQQAGDPVRAIEINTTVQLAATTTAFSVVVYSHAAATFETTSRRSAFINGGSKGTNTTLLALATNLNTSAIGFIPSSTPVSFFPGNVAEIAVWNVTLTDDEIASLAKGFSPRRIRPQSLVFYAPLIREIQDLRKGLALTAVNSPTVSAHPRVY